MAVTLRTRGDLGLAEFISKNVRLPGHHRGASSPCCRLKLYYQITPDGVRGRCPTWIFLSAAARAFEGSGELEDGTVVKGDIICILASLIDHVSLQ